MGNAVQHAKDSLQSLRRQFGSSRTRKSTKNETANEAHQHHLPSLPELYQEWQDHGLAYRYRRSTGRHVDETAARCEIRKV